MRRILFQLLWMSFLIACVLRSNYLIIQSVSWMTAALIAGIIAKKLDYITALMWVGLSVALSQLAGISLIPVVYGWAGLGLSVIVKLLALEEFRPKLLLLVIISLFISVSFYEGKEVRQEIQPIMVTEKYGHDTRLYLRVYQLMNQGLSYYDALVTGYNQDFRTSGYPKDIWGFRLPTVFYLWYYATFGHTLLIYYLFLGLMVGVIFLSLKISSAVYQSPKALLAPFALIPYLVSGSTSWEFFQPEWWGLFPMSVSIYAMLKNKPKILFTGAFLAVLCRETYALPIVGMAIIGLIFKKKNSVLAIFMAGLAVITVYLIHGFYVFNLIPYTESAVFSGRQHVLTLEFIRQVLAFSTLRYLLAPFKLLSLFAVLSLVIAGICFIKRPHERFKLLVLLGSFCLSLFSFVRIGLCCWSDYWGVMVGPVIVLAASTLINLVVSNEN